VEKRREGIIPRRKNHGREFFLGVKNNGREKFREGKIPYSVHVSCIKDNRNIFKGLVYRMSGILIPC